MSHEPENPFHSSNHDDSADLEIARLKAELEELRAWNQKQQEAFYHLRTRVEVMDQLKDELAKARAQDVVARAESSRLTEALKVIAESQCATGLPMTPTETIWHLENCFMRVTGIARSALHSRDNPPCGGSSCFLSDNGEWAHGSKSVGCRLSSGDSE